MAVAEETHLGPLGAFTTVPGRLARHTRALPVPAVVRSNVHSIVVRSCARSRVLHSCVVDSRFSQLSRLAVTLRLCFVACLRPANADERCAGVVSRKCLEIERGPRGTTAYRLSRESKRYLHTPAQYRRTRTYARR